MSQLNLCMDNELVHLHILFGMFEPVIFRGDFDYPLCISNDTYL